MFVREFVAPSPVAIVSKLTEGNSAAADFALELVSLRPFLLKRAIRLTRRYDLAEDLVQTTLARALQAGAQFTPGTNLKGWVATILHHEFCSHHRRSWRSTPLSDELAASIASPFGEQESSLDLQQIACALNDLPDSQREALVAIGLLGFSYEEAAVLLGCGIGTVKSRVSRARIGLMEALQRRDAARRRLIPESPQAFATWLTELETMRVVACAILRSEAPLDALKLPSLSKIPLKPAASASTLRVQPRAAPRATAPLAPAPLAAVAA